MCRYWKKLHTCTHPSDRPYIEMCRPGFLSNTVCSDISEDPSLRPSHFPCYPCIKQSAYTEAIEKQAHAHALAAAAETAREQAAKHKVEVEKRAREERVRREAREKAERERANEERMRVEREKEMERMRREGGPWVLAEAGSGKKKKGRVSGPGSPASPTGVFGAGGAVRKENAKTGWKETEKSWKEAEKSTEASGRAGTWGPKKILSRKEGAADLLGGRMDVPAEQGGKK